jgi:hypothetical protein
MKLFEVFLAPGAQASEIMSPEALADSGAQIFTPAEAELVGLEGIPQDPQNRPRVFIACGAGDAQFVTTRLEATTAVSSFKLHEL